MEIYMKGTGKMIKYKDKAFLPKIMEIN